MKSQIPRNLTTKSYGFLSCLDGSDKALKTMETIAKIANPKTDQVYACTVIEAFDENNQKLEMIEEGYSLKALEFSEVCKYYMRSGRDLISKLNLNVY